MAASLASATFAFASPVSRPLMPDTFFECLPVASLRTASAAWIRWVATSFWFSRSCAPPPTSSGLLYDALGALVFAYAVWRFQPTFLPPLNAGARTTVALVWCGSRSIES